MGFLGSTMGWMVSGLAVLVLGVALVLVYVVSHYFSFRFEKRAREGRVDDRKMFLFLPLPQSVET